MVVVVVCLAERSGSGGSSGAELICRNGCCPIIIITVSSTRLFPCCWWLSTNRCGLWGMMMMLRPRSEPLEEVVDATTVSVSDTACFVTVVAVSVVVFVVKPRGARYTFLTPNERILRRVPEHRMGARWMRSAGVHLGTREGVHPHKDERDK